jgi:hypothetical protein
MSVLDKLVALSAQGTPASSAGAGDPAAELVRAALTAAEELRMVLLASSDPDDDGDDDSSGKNGGPGDTDNDAGHASHPLFRRLKKQGMPDAKAASMCAKADKQVKASALAESVTVALSGLTAAQGGWAERTAYDRRAAVALAGSSAKEPYGDVQYADPGYQADGKRRFPLDTSEHVRLSWSLINQGDSASQYQPEHLGEVRNKIKLAARKHGIDIADDGEKVAATMVALAAPSRMPQAPLQAVHHAPMTGHHSHGNHTGHDGSASNAGMW